MASSWGSSGLGWRAGSGWHGGARPACAAKRCRAAFRTARRIRNWTNCRFERSRDDFDCYLAIVRSQYGGVMSSGDEIGPNEARDLGMGARIDRRDFLQGAAITAAAFGLAPEIAQAAALERAAQDQPGYYPPAPTGMSGSHPGPFG